MICKYVSNYYKEQQEVGEIGGSFSGTVKSIVPLPMVICCGRLGGRWFDSAGRFLFVFLENLLFWGAGRRAARDLGPPEKAMEKAIDGHIPMGPKNMPRRQKPRSWR